MVILNQIRTLRTSLGLPGQLARGVERLGNIPVHGNHDFLLAMSNSSNTVGRVVQKSR